MAAGTAAAAARRGERADCQTVEAHHTGEDTGLFPWLAERHRQLAGFFRRPEEEHRDIERTRTRIAGLIRGGGDQAAVREELEALSRELLAHLDREEAERLPVLRALAA
ncbi:hemerythrin domain-containing protein [Streptomyces goshikiensis]|uniref:hemerythrin domain-containing protein n=1 Tax=Streptomyces goshikiensis TaxID=1942 RepID=UPI0036AF5DF1